MTKILLAILHITVFSMCTEIVSTKQTRNFCHILIVKRCVIQFYTQQYLHHHYNGKSTRHTCVCLLLPKFELVI